MLSIICRCMYTYLDVHKPKKILSVLTHLPLAPHICVSESDQYWFRKWLVAYSAPRHYLNQWSLIVNWTKLQGTNFSEIFSFKKMHLKTSSAKWRPVFPGGDELTKGKGLDIHSALNWLSIRLAHCCVLLWLSTDHFICVLQEYFTGIVTITWLC